MGEESIRYGISSAMHALGRPGYSPSTSAGTDPAWRTSVAGTGPMDLGVAQLGHVDEGDHDEYAD